jgi:hypothetical protein
VPGGREDFLFEKSRGPELSKSLKCKECAGNRSLRPNCLGVVTNGDNVTHKNFTEMRRLAHEGTPFLLDIPPKSTMRPNSGGVTALW